MIHDPIKLEALRLSAREAAAAAVGKFRAQTAAQVMAQLVQVDFLFALTRNAQAAEDAAELYGENAPPPPDTITLNLGSTAELAVVAADRLCQQLGLSP